jgi:hypothetical protein
VKNDATRPVCAWCVLLTSCPGLLQFSQQCCPCAGCANLTLPTRDALRISDDGYHAELTSSLTFVLVACTGESYAPAFDPKYKGPDFNYTHPVSSYGFGVPLPHVKNILSGKRVTIRNVKLDCKAGAVTLIPATPKGAFAAPGYFTYRCPIDGVGCGFTNTTQKAWYFDGGAQDVPGAGDVVATINGQPAQLGAALWSKGALQPACMALR